jgi:hypothetical protein
LPPESLQQQLQLESRRRSRRLSAFRYYVISIASLRGASLASNRSSSGLNSSPATATRCPPSSSPSLSPPYSTASSSSPTSAVIQTMGWLAPRYSVLGSRILDGTKQGKPQHQHDAIDKCGNCPGVHLRKLIVDAEPRLNP